MYILKIILTITVITGIFWYLEHGNDNNAGGIEKIVHQKPLDSKQGSDQNTSIQILHPEEAKVSTNPPLPNTAIHNDFTENTQSEENFSTGPSIEGVNSAIYGGGPTVSPEPSLIPTAPEDSLSNER